MKDVIMKGVYHVAREIQLICPNEITNIILCLESFHMAKVALYCLGKYLRGSGAENILTESDNLDVSVVESVLNGRNYSMSDRLQLLKEALSRLQWDEFFPKDSKMDKYRDQLAVGNYNTVEKTDFRKVKEASMQKASQNVKSSCGAMIEDFDRFVRESCQESKTFK